VFLISAVYGAVLAAGEGAQWRAGWRQVRAALRTEGAGGADE
jgi:hypothetical protein